MNWLEHIVTIIIAWVLLTGLKIIPPSLVIPASAILLSSLMDADLKLSFFKHRGFTHSYVFILLAILLSILVFQGTGQEKNITIGILLGGIMHKLCDGVLIK